MRFARRVFMAAGIYGLLVLLPQYLLETKTGLDFPPAITHPEYYYGFIGVGVAWQVAFLLIARDPGGLRPLMIPAVLEKASFSIAVFVLYAGGRVATPMLVVAMIDFGLGILFTMAYFRARPA
jgi:hypothetical protein